MGIVQAHVQHWPTPQLETQRRRPPSISVSSLVPQIHWRHCLGSWLHSSQVRLDEESGVDPLQYS